ncbi:tRNA lysidine(34) synthetase TilS [Lysobacter sp. F6437]|uniref:tRNA lysidine(34) synthetase TilS n=1 Tax=Lysobacter sp. F6437 TaxID=3459296 RepID=UPI00403E2FF3
MHALPALLDNALQRLPAGPLCVGFSGGMDSTVLLQALAASPAARTRGLRAWHVHHGLHADADQWVAECEATCAGLSIPLTVTRVEVERDAGTGPEASARQARRASFRDGLADGEILVFAHHRDDQAETFLLRAMRASGPDGLAAMRDWRDFGPGHLWRPLLGVPRASLEEYATAHGLHWVEDPGNADTSFDRNFLRQQVLPLLGERWPHASAALARSAALCDEAAGLLDSGDDTALADVSTDDAASLSRSRLSALAPARRARVLRRWIDRLGLPPLPAKGVVQLESTLLPARADAMATFEWHGAVIHAWRDLLHAEWRQSSLPDDWQVPWDGTAPLSLPTHATLYLRAVQRAPGFGRALLVHSRRGGERITLPGRDHGHALKQVLQDLAVPPWKRARLPLLSTTEGELLAAGDRILSAAFEQWLREHGTCLQWSPAPRQSQAD